MADYSRQRAERDFNMNPPSNAPGQGGDDWDAIFADSSQGAEVNNFSGADTNVNNILNGTQNTVNGNQVQNTSNTSMQQQSSFGDKLGGAAETAAIAGAKGLWAYLKAVFTSIKGYTRSDWNKLGTRVCKISCIVFILSILCLLMSKTFIPSLSDGLDAAIGSCLSLIVGLVLVGFNKKGSEVTNEVISEPITDSNDEDEDYSNIFDDEEIEESPYYDEDEEDYSNMFEESFDDDDFSDIDTSMSASNESFSVESAVNSIVNVPEGQYTRQFLFETFSKILPIINPSFMDMKDIPDSSDEFMMFEDYLRRSAEQTGLVGDKLDELQLVEARKNLFIIQLLATRPTGLKEKEIAQGIADCYKKDDYGAMIEGREGVFCRVNSQVGRLIIDIFLCNDVMVSLGDVYRKKSDFVLDINNTMPLIWGVSEMGSVFCYDGMKDGNGGMLISGEARSGKSWKGQSLIAQMCMFMSPKELEFYFYDVKGKASDYAYLSSVLPHCKGFCGESLKFNDSISSLLERESTRRTNLLAGKYTNVKDYNKDHPYDKIPTTYIVIDEMATAMSEMKDRDIEIRKRFDSLLIQIATKYPYLELKLLLFPHRIVNDIINKTVSSMISTRSVMGNVPIEELKTALDIKRDFPYSLVKTGDMAIKTKSLNNGNAVYSHSEVLSTSEQVNRKIFDYIGAVWGKLMPDEKGIKGSTIGSAQSVSDDVKTSNNSGKRNRTVDTSQNVEGYSYSQTVRASEVDTLFDDATDSADESFWDEILNNSNADNSGSSSSEDSFWDDFNN